MRAGPSELVADVPEGVTVETVTRDDARIGSIGAPVDRTGITAWAGASGATALTLNTGVELDRAARLTVVGDDPELKRPPPSTFTLRRSRDPRAPCYWTTPVRQH